MQVSEDVKQIAEQIKALSPPDKLRLAADLLEKRMGQTALPIIESVALELSAAIALRAMTTVPTVVNPSAVGNPNETPIVKL